MDCVRRRNAGLGNVCEGGGGVGNGHDDLGEERVELRGWAVARVPVPVDAHDLVARPVCVEGECK